MRTEREYWIGELLAPRQDGPSANLDCPDITDLMDVALEQARPEVVARVDRHQTHCPRCRRRLAVYRATAQAEETADTRSPAHTSMSLTALGQAQARDPAARPLFEQKLRPWLHGFLHRWNKHLDEPGLGALLDDVCRRLPGLLPTQRLRDVLPAWIEEFFAARGQKGNIPLPSDVGPEMIEQVALDRVLREGGEGDLEAARRFRQRALEQRLLSMKDFLRYWPDEAREAAWWPNYRLQLYFAMERVKAEGLQLLECD